MNRRNFFAGASLFALAGCTKCKLPPIRPVEGAISDAHAHFFNASDLPVRGFLRHVIAPAWFPNLPGIALALGDLAGELAKRLSITARSELQRLGPGTLLGQDGPDANMFGREAAGYQEKIINARGFVSLATRSPETNLGDSHLLLAILLGVAEFPRITGSERDAFGNGIAIDEQLYAEIADEDARSGDARPNRPVPEAYRHWAERGSVDVKSIIRWVFLMCKSRCAHVLKYNEVVRTPALQASDVANLLVDYDAWLSDGPLTGSGHADQVRYWTRYADVTNSIEGATRLHTFAGFCPLKAAEEQLRGATESTLERMKPWVAAGRGGDGAATHRIVGFKLYPPMGFRPDTNAGLVLPDGRAASGIQERWSSEKWPLSEIGNRLDTALDQFFRFCAESDVPIITHAAMSNGSMAGADQMAAPLHWLERAKMVASYGMHPLRVSLGHFDMYGFNNMVLEEALRMNRDPRLRTNIFFDLSYDEDILAGSPVKLLDDLATSCQKAGDDGDYVMFGTDWIMLGQQRNAPRYLGTLRDAASAHGFWRDRSEKLFRTNFLRFLNLRP